MEFLRILSYLLIYICLPAVGIATLVYFIMLLKQMTGTMKKVDSLADNVEHKLELLEGPIDTIVNVHENYLRAVSSVGAALSAVTMFVNRKNKKKEKK
ncbi:hypothetical protein LJB88_02835 [Erysipelotrichaceae bacterium OttesenSCG-928-M19]|nr:hypothetical protein [Erysipelotrichaceae bacterium OttesenSCG-928-M19]